MLNAVPFSVNKRLNVLSSNKEVFDQAKEVYQKALIESCFDYELYFDEDLKNNNPKKNKRKRKVVWYNPPFCRSVKTNLGKEFLRIVSESFPPSHKLHKIFNRNSLKLSYSCLPNIGNKILANTLQKYRVPIDPNLTTKECVGHRRSKECPIENKKCNLQNNIYNAQIVTEDKTYNYIGMSAQPLRLRVATHLQSFKSENNQTELSGKIKELEKNGTQFEVKFI